MMGHRGVRLGITCPEVSEMQMRALDAPLPVLGNGFEHDINHAIAGDKLLDIGCAEHDGGNARHTVGRGKTQVIAGLAHTCPVAHRDARRRQQRHAIALAERLEQRDLFDRGDIELRELDRCRHLAGILERLFGKLCEHGLQPVTQQIEILGLKRHAHRARMAAKPDEHVGAPLDGIE